jgi:type VI protein secretion system component Hcp
MRLRAAGGITVSKTTDSTSPNLFQQSVTNNPIQETDFHLNIPLIEP